jgi:hypothetical protein
MLKKRTFIDAKLAPSNEMAKYSMNKILIFVDFIRILLIIRQLTSVQKMA